MLRLLMVTVLVVGLIGFHAHGAAADAGDPPDTIVGTITIDGHNAPAGTAVSVMSLGETCDTEIYSGTVFTLTLDPAKGACWQPASQLRFLVGDRFADQVIRPPLMDCTQLHLDLTIGGGSPATTLAVPAVVAPVPCPIPAPSAAPGGGGTIGGSGGCGSRGGPGFRLASGKCA